MSHSIKKTHLAKFWDDEFKHLLYINEEFNDPENLKKWTEAGYPPKFTGYMCDMRSVQPSWNQRIIDIFEAKGWKDIGTSYYRMDTGTVLPTHSDLYKKYIDIFDLQGQEQSIRRAVLFLEDWQPGHYAEYMDVPFTDWRAGAMVEWTYDTPHLAANLGLTPRYTLQITGHV
jgi:hypothetical protein